MKLHFNRICIGFLLILSFAACAKQYSAEAIEAWVVDAETGKPLEGVIVTANWQVLEGTLAGTNTGGQLQVLEAVTDVKGRFRFPAWGPKPLPPRKSGWMVDQYIGNEDPQLVLFKSGYEMVKLTNHLIVSQRNTASVRKSIWNGQTIKLKRFQGGAKEYADHLRAASDLLNFVDFGVECEWTKVPHMLVALEKEDLRLRAQNPSAFGPFDVFGHIERIPQYPGCPSPKAFFKEYLQ